MTTALIAVLISLAPSANPQTFEEFPPVGRFLQVQSRAPAAPAAEAEIPESYALGQEVSIGPEDFKPGPDGQSRFAQIAGAMFEGYIAASEDNGDIHWGLLDTAIARRGAKRVLSWNEPFLRAHAQGGKAAMSLTKENVAGAERVVVKTEFDYNGHTVVNLRFRLGNESAASVTVDGSPFLNDERKDGLFITGTQEQFESAMKKLAQRVQSPP